MYTISKIIPDTITYKGNVGYLKKVKFSDGEEWFGYKSEGSNSAFCDFHNNIGICVKFKTEKYLYEKLKELNLVVF